MATGLRHELLLGGTWVDVSSDVRYAAPTRITRGASGGRDLTGSAPTCTFTLGDPDGDYEPDNPTGTYFGEIGAGVEHRVSVDAEESHLWIHGDDAPTASTPDDAAFNVTDLDVAIELTMADWRKTSPICGQWVDGGGLSWAIQLTRNLIFLLYSTDGSTPAWMYSTAAYPWETGRHALRVTLDADNGASGKTATFYVADSIDGPWTQLGDTVTTAGTITLYNAASALAVGDTSSGTRFTGRVHAFTLLDGIDGTAVADPDFTAQTAGAATFDDDAGNTWTINNSAVLRDRDYLWWGELRDLPHDQDSTGTDVTIDATSYDISTRLLTGDTDTASAYRRSLTGPTTVLDSLTGYWPLEDGPESGLRSASGLPGGLPLQWVGAPDMATSSDFVCSDSLPVLAAGDAVFGAVFSTTPGEIQMRFLLLVPSGGVPAQTRVFKLTGTGTAHAWEVEINTSGQLRVVARDSTGVVLLTSSWVAFAVNGRAVRIGLTLVQDGADVDWQLSTIDAVQQTAAASSSTLAGHTCGRQTSLVIAPDKALDGCVIGHITTQEAATSVYENDDALVAYSGPYADHETAAGRLQRLTGYEDIDAYVVGSATYSARMGPQRVDSIGGLIRELAEADGGILTAATDIHGLTYRTRTSMTAQPAALTLSYSGNDLSDWAPLRDAELVTNQLLLSRTKGSTQVVEATTGPMSTSSTLGRIPRSQTINIELDTGLPAQAYWRLHVGTADSPRVPGLPVELARPAITDAQAAALRGLTIGDRIDVTGLPTTRYPYDLSLLVVGVADEVDQFLHRRTLRCWPYCPHQVGVYDLGVGYPTDPQYTRYAGEGTVLAEDLDTTETGIDITAPGRVRWGYDDDYDVVVGGEQMTVTGISGASPNYTLTVTRSVNSVVKTHSAGDAIDIYQPHYYGFTR
jgi:hypothetical protein